MGNPTDIRTKLSAEKLREIIHYDSDTGKFTWIGGNNQHADAEAGWIENTGYIRIKILGRTYGAHRLAWLYVIGKWPMHRIDHINGIVSDNRFSNLREANDAESNRNRGFHKKRKRSYLPKGVELHVSGKYRPRITVNRKTISLGLYDTAEEAGEAYRIATEKYFGQFARKL